MIYLTLFVPVVLYLFEGIFDEADYSAAMDLCARECEADWEIYN